MKKAIITGASSGLGKEIAKQLISKNIKVINLSRSPCNIEGVDNIETDLTNDEAIISAVNKIKSEHSDVNILIMNSGLAHWAEVGQIDDKSLDNDFAVNTIGPIKIINGLISLLEKNKGDVITICSNSSYRTNPNQSIYVSAKHAILGFMKSLQAEMKKKDVRVITISPGGFQSQFHVKAESGLKQEDLMKAEDLAKFVINIIELPRNMQISEVIIDRKKLN